MVERVVKDLLLARVDRNDIIELSIWFYVIALLIFTAKSDWTIKGWVDGYFMWDKLKDCIWLSILYATLPERKRNRYFTILFYSFLRFIWEVIATAFKINVNYDFIIDWFFYIILTRIIILTIKDLRKNVKENVAGPS